MLFYLLQTPKKGAQSSVTPYIVFRSYRAEWELFNCQPAVLVKLWRTPTGVCKAGKNSTATERLFLLMLSFPEFLVPELPQTSQTICEFWGVSMECMLCPILLLGPELAQVQNRFCFLGQFMPIPSNAVHPDVCMKKTKSTQTTSSLLTVQGEQLQCSAMHCILYQK